MALKFCIFALGLHDACQSLTNLNMKITIINTERNEKRYTRIELDEFIAQLRDGTYRQQYVCDFTRRNIA